MLENKTNQNKEILGLHINMVRLDSYLVMTYDLYFITQRNLYCLCTHLRKTKSQVSNVNRKCDQDFAINGVTSIYNTEQLISFPVYTTMPESVCGNK